MSKSGKGGKKDSGAAVPAKAPALPSVQEPTIDDQIEAALQSHTGKSVTNRLREFADQNEKNLEALASAIKRLLREGKG